MKIRHIISAALLLLLTAVFAGSTRSHVAAAPARQGANLLNNASFERPYSNGAANGWGRWHQEINSNPKPENCSAAYAARPSWSEETNSDLVLDGFISQHVGNQFDTWHAGVVQDVNVNPGSRYRFSFWARGRASNEQYPAPSNGEVNLGVQARVDPNGSGLWSDGDVVGGAIGSPHDNWQEFSVEVTATGNRISVFAAADIRGANQCRAHMDVWFDRASVVEVAPPATNTPLPPPPTNTPLPPPPPPPATNTPLPPTNTPTPENTPTNTPVPPTPTHTPTPTPAGGTLCLNAFADDNKNGVRDESEGYMAGVGFTVARDGAAVAQGVSTGIATPLCFSDLEPGMYQVAQTAPATLELTTAPNTTVELAQGDVVGVEFGSRFRTAGDSVADAGSAQDPSAVVDATATAFPTLAPSAPEPGGGPNLLAISGLVAIVLAIGLLGGLIALVMRQSR